MQLLSKCYTVLHFLRYVSTNLFSDWEVRIVRSFRLLLQAPDVLYGFRILRQPTHTHRTDNFRVDYWTLLHGKCFRLLNFAFDCYSNLISFLRKAGLRFSQASLPSLLFGKSGTVFYVYGLIKIALQTFCENWKYYKEHKFITSKLR